MGTKRYQCGSAHCSHLSLCGLPPPGKFKFDYGERKALFRVLAHENKSIEGMLGDPDLLKYMDFPCISEQRGIKFKFHEDVDAFTTTDPTEENIKTFCEGIADALNTTFKELYVSNDDWAKIPAGRRYTPSPGDDADERVEFGEVLEEQVFMSLFLKAGFKKREGGWEWKFHVHTNVVVESHQARIIAAHHRHACAVSSILKPFGVNWVGGGDVDPAIDEKIYLLNGIRMAYQFKPGVCPTPETGCDFPFCIRNGYDKTTKTNYFRHYDPERRYFPHMLFNSKGRAIPAEKCAALFSDPEKVLAATSIRVHPDATLTPGFILPKTAIAVTPYRYVKKTGPQKRALRAKTLIRNCEPMKDKEKISALLDIVHRMPDSQTSRPEFAWKHVTCAGAFESRNRESPQIVMEVRGPGSSYCPNRRGAHKCGAALFRFFPNGFVLNVCSCKRDIMGRWGTCPEYRRRNLVKAKKESGPFAGTYFRMNEDEKYILFGPQGDNVSDFASIAPTTVTRWDDCTYSVRSRDDRDGATDFSGIGAEYDARLKEVTEKLASKTKKPEPDPEDVGEDIDDILAGIDFAVPAKKRRPIVLEEKDDDEEEEVKVEALPVKIEKKNPPQKKGRIITVRRPWKTTPPKSRAS